MDDRAVLDTNVVSYVYSESEYAQYYRPIFRSLVEPFISYYTLVELRYGARRKNWGSRKIGEMENFIGWLSVYYPDEALCDRHVDLRIYLESRGITIGAADLWIAATALELDCPLVSHNARHFRDIPGLRLLTAEGGI